jgi:hypothetical protein
VAVLYKTHNVFDLLNTGVMGSNPLATGMYVGDFSVLVSSYVDRGLALGRSRVQGALPNV